MTSLPQLTIQHATAPLGEPVACQLVEFLAHKGHPWIDDIQQRARGSMPGVEDHFFIALRGTRPAGHVWYTTDQSDRRLGLIGHVYTHPDYRRQGIAGVLMERAMQEFRHRGGMVMQLFTSTPYSLPFYEKLGFANQYSQQVYHERDWYMCCPTGASSWLADWFVSGEVRMRPLAPADLPRYCLLYNAQRDCVLKDRAQQIGSGLEAELAFIHVLERATTRRGVVYIAENAQLMVGASALVCSDFPHQSHIALFDIYLHSTCVHYARSLADRCLSQREALGAEYIYALAADQTKRMLLPSLGFQSRGIWPRHFRLGQQRLRCELFEWPERDSTV